MGKKARRGPQRARFSLAGVEEFTGVKYGPSGPQILMKTSHPRSRIFNELAEVFDPAANRAKSTAASAAEGRQLAKTLFRNLFSRAASRIKESGFSRCDTPTVVP